MRSKRILGVALAASLLLATTACGDDDDDAATTTTTPDATETEGPTEIEVTLTSDGFDGMPSELPAGLVEIILVNETDVYGTLDMTRVADGTTEDEFLEGLAPVFEGGAFPDFFESNAGVDAEAGETKTSLITLREGEHIVWYEAGSGDEGEGDEGPETETETETVTETEPGGDAPETTVAGDGDETTTSTTATDEEPTTTVAGDEEQGAPAVGEPEGTLTAAAAEDDETETETEDDTGTDTETEAEGGDEGGGQGPPDVVTAELTVTAGDDSAELPEADGEIVAVDYSFEATLDGPGTINFRNDGPEQFHHAVVVDFGTNDPEAVEEAFPELLESGPGAPPEAGGDLDMDQVDFEFGASGGFGPDGVGGTFEADIVEGNTYVLACFIQDREGGPPHAIAHDMWEVAVVGGQADSTATTDG